MVWFIEGLYVQDIVHLIFIIFINNCMIATQIFILKWAKPDVM